MKTKSLKLTVIAFLVACALPVVSDGQRQAAGYDRAGIQHGHGQCRYSHGQVPELGGHLREEIPERETLYCP